MKHAGSGINCLFLLLDMQLQICETIEQHVVNNIELKLAAHENTRAVNDHMCRLMIAN